MARLVTIVADDYGIGPETSRGILELARAGALTATVLIVNCPDSEDAVRKWQAARPDIDLGWHPNLTLDFPVSPREQVPSLVADDGKFWPLGAFLKRLALGRIRERDVETELRAQHKRFIHLVGNPPPVVNAHQHVALFPPVSRALFRVLDDQWPRPYLRRVVESPRALFAVPGARLKRAFLSLWGKRAALNAEKLGYPGCDTLTGVTDHACVSDVDFWVRRLDSLSGGVSLEICCHPGYRDETLLHRDCDEDGLRRRTDERQLLLDPSFVNSLRRSRRTPVRPSRLAA